MTLRQTVRLEWITAPALALLIVAAWQMYVSIYHTSPFLLPSPGTVFQTFSGLIRVRSTWLHLWVTAAETLTGFTFACVSGIGMGLVVGKLPWLERTVNPFVVAMQLIPKVALVPLFVVWFGFGSASKIIVSAVLAFFPIFVNTVLGVKSVDPGYRELMTALNANRFYRLWCLDLPATAPYVLSGMELGIVLAVIGCIVGEIIGGNSGLGYLLVAKMNAYQTDGLFAVIVLLTLLGCCFYAVLGLLRRVVIPWHGSAGKPE